MDAIEMKDRCVQWIRDWFEKNGKNCNAVIGISGGKDSTIAAALCVEALGAGRVIGVMMPDGKQKDIVDAQFVCDWLNIKPITVNIKRTMNKLISSLTWGGVDLSEQALINLAPRIRMATLYAVSQSNNGRVVNTCNYSEEYLGYSTLWGDDVGDFSPLGNCTVAEVKALGYALGLPARLIEKTPSDGLCGSTDEERFGFTYDELDKYITGKTDPAPEIKELIDKRHTANCFKQNKILPTWNDPLLEWGYNFWDEN